MDTKIKNENYEKSKFWSAIINKSVGLPAHLLALLITAAVCFLSFRENVYHGIGLTLTSICSFLHLLLVASHFGTQIWVSFVAGVTMIKVLPRRMFGNVQSRLFPRYFMLGFLETSFSIVTFLGFSKGDSWKNSRQIHLTSQLVCLFCCLANWLYIAPASISVMRRRHQLEKEAGVADALQVLTPPELQSDATYRRVQSRFIALHAFSAVVNLAGLCANGVHIFYLSQRLV